MLDFGKVLEVLATLTINIPNLNFNKVVWGQARKTTRLGGPITFTVIKIFHDKLDNSTLRFWQNWNAIDLVGHDYCVMGAQRFFRTLLSLNVTIRNLSGNSMPNEVENAVAHVLGARMKRKLNTIHSFNKHEEYVKISSVILKEEYPANKSHKRFSGLLKVGSYHTAKFLLEKDENGNPLPDGGSTWKEWSDYGQYLISFSNFEHIRELPKVVPHQRLDLLPRLARDNLQRDYEFFKQNEEWFSLRITINRSGGPTILLEEIKRTDICTDL